MSDRMGGSDIAKLALQARRSRKKKTLALYMDEHFEELRQELVKGTNWVELTIMFRKLGLKNAWGHEPNEGTVRRTWHRVEVRDRQAAQPARSKTTVRLLASPNPQPASFRLQAGQEPPSLSAFPQQNDVGRSVEETGPSTVNATSEIERALRQVRRRSLPMPVRMDGTTKSDL